MGDKVKALVIIGTRPEAIKLAPVVLAMRPSEKLCPVVLCTGQHTTMAIEALSCFDISPDYQFNMIDAGGLAEGVSYILPRISEVIDEVKPRFVVVQGDTTSALAGALAGFYSRVDVVHVEAGLRTQDMYNPFPEEGNRAMIDRIAAINFPPTSDAYGNLINENCVTCFMAPGNTAIDALRIMYERNC